MLNSAALVSVMKAAVMMLVLLGTGAEAAPTERGKQAVEMLMEVCGLSWTQKVGTLSRCFMQLKHSVKFRKISWWHFKKESIR